MVKCEEVKDKVLANGQTLIRRQEGGILFYVFPSEEKMKEICLRRMAQIPDFFRMAVAKSSFAVGVLIIEGLLRKRKVHLRNTALEETICYSNFVSMQYNKLAKKHHICDVQ